MMFTSVKNGSVFKLLKSVFGGNTSDTDPIITIRASYCGIPFVPIPSMQPTDVQVDSTTASAVMAHKPLMLMRFRHRASRKNPMDAQMDTGHVGNLQKNFKLPNISILHTRLFILPSLPLLKAGPSKSMRSKAAFISLISACKDPQHWIQRYYNSWRKNDSKTTRCYTPAR